MRNTDKYFMRSMIIILLLALGLAVTTFALVYSMVAVKDNLFQTGNVSINLNDGKAVIREEEFLFEPGMKVTKPFFIENESSCPVYYKLYFGNVEGPLGELLEVTVRCGETVLYRGTPKSLSRDAVSATEQMLGIGQRQELTVEFFMPPEIGNKGQGQYMRFDISADAVQVKNNDNREFD